MQFSIVLLAASLGYQLTGIGYIDSIGALVIGALAYREGREAQEKTKGKSCCGRGSRCSSG